VHHYLLLFVCTLDITKTIKLVRQFSSVFLLEGDTVTLFCSPTIRRTILWWTHNGTSVMDRTTSAQPSSTHFLPIMNASIDDSGLYSCCDAMDRPVLQQNITVTVLPGKN